MSLVSLVVLFIVAGVVSFLIYRAPFIAEPYKTFAQYAILVCVVLYVLFGFFGAGLHDVRIPTYHR